MKIFALSASAALAVLLLAPTTASAGHPSRKVSGHCNVCRQPVYAYPTVIGYNHYRQPIVRWISRPHSHGHSYRSRSPYDYGRSSYGRGSSCPQDYRGHPSSRYRSSRGTSFQFSFGR